MFPFIGFSLGEWGQWFILLLLLVMLAEPFEQLFQWVVAQCSFYQT